jgi:broad specificity phosphatase PhoE
VTALLLIRHGPTAWNAEKRLQGRADIPLSEAGLEQVSRWRLPEAFIAFDWWVSPLLRARQTAEALRLTAGVEPRLIEMDYGAFEGRTIAHLRRELGSEMMKNEDRGLDFTPPGGESPRRVQDRLRPMLAEIRRPTGGVTHKGVIRALMALATDWDMIGKPPVRLDWSSAHLFQLDGDGGVSLDRPNISLDPES